MGRRLKLRDDDQFKDGNTIRIYKDDRKQAANVETPKQLDMFLDRDGAVARRIADEGGDDRLTEYAADGSRKVNVKNTQKAVKDLREEITNSRFYEKTYIDSVGNSADLREGDRKLTRREKININKREYQTRAIGLQTVVRAGNVEISNYDKGILNQLAAGNYDDVVYGKQDSSGRRRFEQGTFRNQLGLGRGAIRSNDPSQRARAREKADQLRESRAYV